MNEGERQAGLAPTADYRYSERVGNQLFVAGQVPLDREGNLVGLEDPQSQVAQCLANLDTLIAYHGFSADDIRHLTIYVVGGRRNLLDAWDRVTEWFSRNVPPATVLGVNLLGYADQLVEVDATIVMDQP